MTRNRARKVALPLLVAGALMLAGCSGSGSEKAEPDTQPEAPAATASQSPEVKEPSPEAAAGNDTGTISAVDVLLRAAKLGAAELDGSTVVGIEKEHGNTWEVELYLADGTSYEVDISADGTQVISGPEREHDDAGDLEKHRDRLAVIEVDFFEAVEILRGQYPEAEITELELDTEHGALVWEADLRLPDGTGVEVNVDVKTGTVTLD